MNEPDAQRIDALGGPAVLARLLGYRLDGGGVQRVSNWKRRGIPAAVKVEHPELLMAPLEAAKTTATERLTSSNAQASAPAVEAGEDGQGGATHAQSFAQVQLVTQQVGP